MKLIIDGREVEIKAKRIGDARFSKEETIELLVTLQLYAADAREFYEKMGLHYLHRHAQKDVEAIGRLLTENGY